MNSETDIPRMQILRAEFQVMMEKEIEMKDLYNNILNRIENEYVRKKLNAIRKDELRHIGYIEIMISLLGLEQEGDTA
jgi:rubrerythrin